MGSASSARTALSDIENVKLSVITGATSADPFNASNLWTNQNQTTLIFVVRRTGCPLCREQAQNLVLRQKDFESLGIPLKAVIHEIIEEDVEGFRAYFGGSREIYHDPTRGFYNAQGNRWLGIHGLLFPSVIAAISRASAKKIEGNTRGEGRLLGGLLVVSPSAGIIFEHREEWFGDHADVDAILKACGFKDSEDKMMDRQIENDSRPPSDMPKAGSTGCA